MIRFKRLERRATGRIILFRKSHIVVVMVTYFIPRILIFSKPWVLLSHNIILFRVAHISKRKNHELAILYRAKYFYIIYVLCFYCKYSIIIPFIVQNSWTLSVVQRMCVPFSWHNIDRCSTIEVFDLLRRNSK